MVIFRKTVKKVQTEVTDDNAVNEVTKPGSNSAVAIGDDIIIYGFCGLALVSSLAILV